MLNQLLSPTAIAYYNKTWGVLPQNNSVIRSRNATYNNLCKIQEDTRVHI